MAKIINDSLLPSAPNAPLDARTEVNLLADIAKIENPSESLIFKVKETGKYYKVISLKEVSIEGTTYKKKVINEYEPFSDLKDAPKDGYKYVRMNGVWVRYQSELDPALPILVVNIKSNQGADSNIDSLKYVVKAGNKEVQMSSGEALNIPIGSNIIIEFPEVENYRKPDDIIVENVTDNLTYEVEYATEKVIINVSAEDGSEVDGQSVTVVEGINILDEYGVAIMDINGKFYKDAAAWQEAGSPAPNGVAISDGIHRLCIAKDVVEHSASTNSDIDKEYWGAYGTIVNGVTTSTDKSIALKDFNGIGNTDSIVANVTSSDGYFTKEPWSAAALCRKFTFPNGRNGYLGAVGEWNLVQGLFESINSLMLAIGGEKLEVIGTASSSYWTSTQANETSVWRWQFSSKDASTLTKENNLRVRAFSTVGNTKIHDVTGGKVEFKSEYGKNYNVSINSKEGDYSHPEAVTFTAGQQQRVINFKYIPLLIDTIYINNSIADSDAIVTGEMNGKAVQSIWNEGKRHLGKYVTKEDGTREMVLIKVDENDSRYFEDGAPIDVEGLGTTAYYFTKIASMAYKITQMSENVYKIQICYKHRPDSTWKYFNESWVPVFFGYAPKYGKTEAVKTTVVNPSEGDLRYLDLYDYSNLMLLMFAKYGINGYKTVEESYEDDSKESVLMNGITLKHGNKDIYRESYYTRKIDPDGAEGTVYSYYMNLLGIENCFIDLRNSYKSIDDYKKPYISGIHIADLKAAGNLANSPEVNVSTVDNEGVARTYVVQAQSKGFADWIRTRHIKDGLFTLLSDAIGASSDTYYKAKIATVYDYEGELPSGDVVAEIQLGFMTGIIIKNVNTRGYLRRKYTGAYRIETDREKFNKLTNTWV